MKSFFIVLLLSFTFLQASELSITQGYAQDKDDACRISVEKVLKNNQESAIKTRCQCYRQDSRDWICYTYFKPQKND
ncbi:MAG: hypothetical protein OEW60_04475 [Thiovulaceae bacterium]|nr:hypothetical protein [Sulfurimonadaceae bacterium]